MTASRHVFCLYSDDIRHEINGKVSLIGIYHGGMNVAGSLPHALPKLVVSAYVNTPVGLPFTDLSIDILQNDEIMQNVKVPPEAFKDLQSNLTIDPGSKMLSLQMVITLQPFLVTGNGRLSVRVHTDGEVLDGNSLRIQTVGPEEAVTSQ